LLPPWFTERMMSDSWCFGLLMVTGDVIAIQSINSIIKDASGNLWLNATLLDSQFCSGKDVINQHPLFGSPPSRTEVSINSSHVVAAFELADT